MSLQVCIAHTGERLQAESGLFASLDALRSWIFQNVGIAQSNQILMTARGKQVKLQTLLTEKEIFVYDRLLISPPSNTSTKPNISEVPVRPPLNPKEPPDVLTSQTDLGAWQDLFKARREWASDLAEKCSVMFDSTRERLDEVRVIQKAVEVAITNLQTHVASLEQKNTDAQAWIQDIAREQEPAITGWKDVVSRLDQVTVKDNILQSRLFRNGQLQDVVTGKRPNAGYSEGPSLGHLVEVASIEQAANTAQDVLQQLDDKAIELGDTVQHVMTSGDVLVRRVKAWIEQSDLDSIESPERLMEDIDVVTKKIASDYEHVLSLSDSSKSLSQASKRALVHTQDYLPSLSDTSVRLSQVHRTATVQRNASVKTAAQHLQMISSVESILANANAQLSTLEVSSNDLTAFGLLNALIRLPYVYGSILVESIRRREWNEKVKADSTVLAEEFAMFTEEEKGRRRRWQRSVNEIMTPGLNDGKPVSVEINLQGDEKPWPHVERQDLNDYMDVLKSLDGMSDIVTELSQLVSDLDLPTRQRSKHAKAFKNSSVHEASLGRSSLLLRGDDELIRSLRDEKVRLEEKLKGSESRVRKLEDIVHRQSDMSRNATGNVFQPTNAYRPELHSMSPSAPQQFTLSTRPRDALSRRSSASSRRVSATLGVEEKALVQRVVSLEAELMAERETTAELRKEAAARKETENVMRGRIDEADSTKKDLMDNLEAQQREFFDERKLLEEDFGKVKVKLEEVEDELDRVLGSRDNERAETDEKARALEEKLEDVRKETRERMEHLLHELELERADLEQHKKSALGSKEEIQRASEERQALEKAAQEIEEQLRQKDIKMYEHKKELEDAHKQLSPEDTTPADFSHLIQAIYQLAERSSDHLRTMEDTLASTKAENEALKSKISQLEAESSALKDELDAKKAESSDIHKTLAKERGRLSSLKKLLKDERAQAKALRAKSANEDNGSEALRERMVEGENKAIDLGSKLAATEAQVNNLEDELQRKNEEIHKLKAGVGDNEALLGARTARAKHVSERLYSLTDRLGRLLETLGFAVSYRDDSMIIQRISRAMGASATEAGAQSPNESRVSTSATAGKATQDSGNLQVASWTDAENQEAESEKYEAYRADIGRFDVEAFSEAISKRMKDTEHVARKWQKEARSYRDKAHRFHLEAHQKIAYRSFREGDLALFLPTRNQATRPWAAFNVGAPHFFLREQDSHKLQTRDWLLARITKVEERVVDLSKTMSNGGQSTTTGDGRSIGGSSDGGGAGGNIEDENPFELSDGLRWYLLDAVEEKPGAPSTPGLGKSTVASANVDARGSVRVKKSAFGSSGATKTLSKSLDSRRNSSNSKKDLNTGGDGSRGSTSAGPAPPPSTASAPPQAQQQQQEDPHSSTLASTSTAMNRTDKPTNEERIVLTDVSTTVVDSTTREPSSKESQIQEEVRRDLLWGP
ncbi:MAG: oligomeric, coiled-coil, peripheral membrane protein [Peltula sp. TS41687]|nr:MAG: oligomeric, coiled-coil, peripheral membrane protein [Peltula sp. TS41687]